MKNNKSSGSNSIAAKHFKYERMTLIKEMTKLIKEILENKKMFRAWKKTRVRPIPEKGNRIEKQHFQMQDSKQKQSTTDQIFILKKTLTIYYKNEILDFCCIYFKTAYGTVSTYALNLMGIALSQQRERKRESRRFRRIQRAETRRPAVDSTFQSGIAINHQRWRNKQAKNSYKQESPTLESWITN